MMEYDHSKEGHIRFEIFLMQSQNDTQLKTEKEGDQLIWMDYRDVVKKISYGNMKNWYDKNFISIKKTVDRLQKETKKLNATHQFFFSPLTKVTP